MSHCTHLDQRAWKESKFQVPEKHAIKKQQKKIKYLKISQLNKTWEIKASKQSYRPPLPLAESITERQNEDSFWLVFHYLRETYIYKPNINTQRMHSICMDAFMWPHAMTRSFPLNYSIDLQKEKELKLTLLGGHWQCQNYQFHLWPDQKDPLTGSMKWMC